MSCEPWIDRKPAKPSGSARTRTAHGIAAYRAIDRLAEALAVSLRGAESPRVTVSLLELEAIGAPEPRFVGIVIHARATMLWAALARRGIGARYVEPHDHGGEGGYERARFVVWREAVP
mgnify:CR=1 FL=1